MKELFAFIYDTIFGIHSNIHYVIFQHLFDNGGYTKLGLTFLLIPLGLWIVFYYFWRYPYGKVWHWLIWFAFTVLVVAGITYGIANSEIFRSNNQALNELLAEPGYYSYAQSLLANYALVNSLLAMIIGFLYSIVLKQFSKIQVHLPF